MDRGDDPRRHVAAAVTTLVDRPASASAPAAVEAPTTFPSMGYQPSLDGLRALSVGVVLLYHGGFSWMHGGFFGVEVFFVVSGFLITSLLLDEHGRNGAVSFRQFWLRRARRLFPALYAVLLAVAVWAALAGTAEQQSQVRRDIPWSVFYVNNWGQILGNVPYFAGEPPLLRHLWSLAVEEQWYLIWPLVFVALLRIRVPRHVIGSAIIAGAFVVFAYMFWMHSRTPTPLGGPPAAFEGVDRTNFLYLSTVTRAGGLLLGAGAAFVWRPWRWTARARCAGGPGPRSRRRRSGGDARLCRLGRGPHRGVRLSVAVAARVDPVAGRRDGRRPSCRCRVPPDHELDAAGRDGQAELRAVPVELADLRDRRRDHRLGVELRLGDGPHGRRLGGLVPVPGNAGAQGRPRPVVERPSDGHLLARSPELRCWRERCCCST